MKTLLFSFQRIVAFACLLLLAVTGWSCKKDDVSARTQAGTLFTLKINKIVDKPDVFYQTPGQNKYYVVVGDASGKLIDYKQLTPQTTFAFDKPEGFADTELTVSYVSYSPKYGYFVSSYRNIPVGQQWVATHLDEVTNSVSIQPSQAKVRVTNIPANAQSLSSLSENSSLSNLATNTDYPIQFSKAFGNNVWFRLNYTNQPPRFFLLQNATANQTYTLDLSLFELGVAKHMAFSKHIPLFWMYVASTPSSDFNSFFWIDNNMSSQTPLVDKIDYYVPNATFSDYQIQAAVYQTKDNADNDQSQISGTFETLPETLPLIEADFAVTTNSPGSFAMTTTGVYDAYMVSSVLNGATASSSVAWGIYGKPQPTVSISYPEIPAAIVSIPTQQLKVQTVNLSEHSQAASYEEYINLNFVGSRGYYTNRTKNL